MASNFTATDAAGYELQMGRWSRLLAQPLVNFARIEPGSRVLDVGCGTGSLTRAIAERIGAGGAVIGVDIAAPLCGACEIDDHGQAGELSGRGRRESRFLARRVRRVALDARPELHPRISRGRG